MIERILKVYFQKIIWKCIFMFHASHQPPVQRENKKCYYIKCSSRKAIETGPYEFSFQEIAWQFLRMKIHREKFLTIGSSWFFLSVYFVWWPSIYSTEKKTKSEKQLNLFAKICQFSILLVADRWPRHK